MKLEDKEERLKKISLKIEKLKIILKKQKKSKKLVPSQDIFSQQNQKALLFVSTYFSDIFPLYSRQTSLQKENENEIDIKKSQWYQSF